MNTTATWLVAAGLALSASAFADTVDITWSNPVIQPGGGDSIAWSGTSAAGSGSAHSGRFRGDVTAYNPDPGPLANAFVDSQHTLYAYCYDLLQDLYSSGTYTVSYSVAARTLDWLGAVNYVLNGNTNLWLDSYAWLHPGDRNTAAAIQLGIWESLYDGSGWSLAAGDFRANGLEGATLTAYNTFKAAVENASANDLSSSLVMAFVSTDNQDVITGRRPDGRLLPEPGSLLLAVIGAAAALWAMRRTR